MTLLLHGSPCADQYLVDVGELVPVTAVNARSAFRMAMASRYGAAQQLCGPIPMGSYMVYQFDAQGELIAVFD